MTVRDPLAPPVSKVQNELDRALCQCGGRDDRDRFFVAEPDVSEFTQIVERYGAFTPSLKSFGEQLTLALK